MIECPYCNSDYKADDIGRVIFREHLGEVHRLSSKESNAVLFAKEVSLEYMEEAHQWWDNNLNQHQKPWDDMNIPERSQVITAYSRYVLSGAESVDWNHIFDQDTADPDINPTKDFVDALSDAGQGGEPMYYNADKGEYTNDTLIDVSQDPTIGAKWQRGEETDWKQFTKDFILHQEDDIHDLLERQKKNASDEEFLWDDNDYGKYKSKFLKKNPQLNEDDFERKIDGSDYYNKESKAKEDDPDFLNDPDFQGYTEDEFGNKLKSHPSQYTLSGWDWEEEERIRDRGDVDYDSLEIKANEDSLLKVEDNDDGGVDVTVLDEWENKGSIEKAIQAGNDDKSTFTVQEESFSDASESNNPPNGLTKASEIEEEEFNKKHFDIEEEEGFGVVYKCKHCGEWLSADMPVGQHAEHIMFDHNIQESNAVGNYQDPAINEEYDREVDQYYVNQDIPMEDPKDG